MIVASSAQKSGNEATKRKARQKAVDLNIFPLVMVLVYHG
jgi:hypothetical protein